MFIIHHSDRFNHMKPSSTQTILADDSIALTGTTTVPIETVTAMRPMPSTVSTDENSHEGRERILYIIIAVSALFILISVITVLFRYYRNRHKYTLAPSTSTNDKDEIAESLTEGLKKSESLSSVALPQHSASTQMHIKQTAQMDSETWRTETGQNEYFRIWWGGTEKNDTQK